jgi:type II secretory pathway pseudopilin PulG
MRLKPNSRPGSKRQEDGFLLLGVLFMVLLITIALAIAAPKMAESIRRDKEVETVHRGMQYARAIQIYFNKYGRYPNTIDQLLKSDNQRFLRRRYLNPMTGKDDWRLIHYGEAKVPAMGLFGQTVGQTGGISPTGATNGTSATGIGGSASPFGGSGSSMGGSNGSLGSSGGSSGISFGNNGSSSSPGSTGSSFGGSGSSFGSGSSTSPFGNSGSSSSTIGGTDSGSGSGFGSTTGAGGTTNNIGGAQTTGGSSSAFGSPGVSVGGAPIVGVGLMDKKTSIKIYKKQTHYNQWEFVYDPSQNTVTASGGVSDGSGASTGMNGGIGTNGGTGVNGGTSGGFSLGNGSGSNSGSGFGSSNGSGFGGSSGSGFGGSPTSPVSPSAPVNNSPQ